MVHFMKGYCSSVIFGGRLADMETWGLLLKHITVHDGLSPTVLFVLLFKYNIGGVKTYRQQIQSKSDFCDVTLV